MFLLIPYPIALLTKRLPLPGLMLIVTLVSGQVSAGIVEDCAPSFEDNFDGSSLAPHWQVSLGDGCDQDLCGWGNNEKQHYDRTQLRVADGQLIIEMALRDDQVVSGKITTEGEFDQQFGRFEARLSLPDARGSWPAFWLLPASEKPWPLTGEIDILEWTGNEPHRVIAAAHFGELAPANVHEAEMLRRPDSWLGDFHTVAVEWRPGEILWEVNGRQHAELRPADIALHRWVFDDLPFYLILNLAVGGTLGGDVALEDMPAEMRVDWVRVYPQACLD